MQKIWTAKKIAGALGVSVRRVQQIAVEMDIQAIEVIDRAQVFTWADVQRMKRRENQRKVRVEA